MASRPGPMTMKRINKELAGLATEDLGEMTLAPTESNIMQWKATIPGPSGSVYEGGVFNVDITLPNDYPFSAPKAVFATRIYHMNISERGQVCVDLLKHNWSPALSLFKVMLSLSSLLTDPNPKDPLVPGIATEYQRKRAQHDSTARKWVQLYALPPKVLPVTAPTPVHTARASTSHTRPQIHTTHSVINVDDMPSPVPRPQSGNTHTHSQASAIPIDISDDEGQTPVPSSRKRKGRDTSVTSQGHGRQKRRMEGEASGSREVIVIE